MPTYQYSCTECGHFFEQFQSFSEDSLTVCPECEGRLRKVFNAVGVVFKGSGFYRTDSRSEKSSEGASAGGNATKPAGGGSSSDSSSPSTGSDSSSGTSSGTASGSSSTSTSGSAA